jgi:PKD repeat protein
MMRTRTTLVGTALLLAVAACDRAPTSATAPERAPAPARRTVSKLKAPRVSSSLAAAAAGLSTTDLNSISAASLVQTIVGPGVAVSNINYTGANVAAGTFNGPAEIVGFGSGIVLSTGNVRNVIGPNQEDDITGVNDTDGDAQLTALAGFPTLDAAVLTFDFVPQGNEVTFRYVFASDEYNEYVNTSFNDVFALYVNGQNCAVIGNPARPVSINTINNGNPSGDPTPTNPSLYRNNDLDDGGGSIDTEMDGLTTVLTCRAPVTAGATNTMKIAIADASDDVLDAVVFIEAESFVVPNRPPVASLEPIPSPEFVGRTVDAGARASDPDNDTPLTCTITWGDGTSTGDFTCPTGGVGGLFTRSHAYGAPGTYTVTLTVRDPIGAVATATRSVTILAAPGGGNQPPVPTLTLSPKTISVGGSTTATVGATDPDHPASALECSVNWGNGAVGPFTPCINAARTFTYSAAGLFTVTVTARDPAGATASVSDTIRVLAAETNTPPEIVDLRTFPEELSAFPIAGTSCYAREQVCIKYTIRDVDPGDTPFTTTVNWGDGSPTYTPNPIPGQNIPLLAYHTYAAPGTYTVTVTATDRRGASSTRTIGVTIAASAP